MKYVLALLVLSLVIFIHEFGHFIVAKASGVTVVEFSLGMGPRIIKFTKKGTMYSLKLFLFGGSCRMLGDDPEEKGEGSFNSVSVWKRIAIVIAGPFFNFLLAFVFSVILIGKFGYDPATMYSVSANSPAAEAGLEAGDTIVEINGTNVNFYGDYSLYMYDHNGESLELKYKRDGKTYTTTVTPNHVTGKVYQMGVYLNTDSTSIASVIADTPAETAGLKAGDIIKSIDGTTIEEYSEISPLVQACDGNEITIVVERDGEEITLSFTPEGVDQDYYDYGFYLADVMVKTDSWSAVKYSFKYFGYWIKYVFKCLGIIISGHAKLNDLSGPVGIVTTIGNVVEQAQTEGASTVILNLLDWCIMISANLGVMNLLPIPALDGGRLVFLIIEAVRKKPVPKEKEGMVHFVGVVLLLILMVIILFNDIAKLFK